MKGSKVPPAQQAVNSASVPASRATTKSKSTAKKASQKTKPKGTKTKAQRKTKRLKTSVCTNLSDQQKKGNKAKTAVFDNQRIQVFWDMRQKVFSIVTDDDHVEIHVTG